MGWSQLIHVLIQISAVWPLALIPSLILIYVLREQLSIKKITHFYEQTLRFDTEDESSPNSNSVSKEDKDDRNNYDVTLMVLVPLVTFLFAESLNLSGLLVLTIMAFPLSLYGTPNME